MTSPLWEPSPRQSEFLSATEDEVLFGGAAGGGKALALDTLIATPRGWATMGELRPGDEVFAMDGTPTCVLAISDVMHDRQCYRVRFSDGAEIVADEQHLWLCESELERSRQWRQSDEFREQRRSTRVLRGSGKKPWVAERNAKRAETRSLPHASVRTTAQLAQNASRHYSVPVAAALATPEAELLVEPYVLGVWLGDGTSASGAITSADAEIVAAVGYDIAKRSGRYDYGTRGLSPKLRMLGVLGNKHVPAAYLRASVEQRIALLQGLMDTDGYCDQRGQCEFTTTSTALRDGVAELLWSLGIKASICEGDALLNGRAVGRKYRLKFLTEFAAFRLPRKLIRQKRAGFRGTHARRYVVAVEPCSSVPVKCIKVAHESGCFLAGRQMVPTHNSDSLIIDALGLAYGAVMKPNYRALLIRQTFPELRELIDRTRLVYPIAVPGAEYHEQAKEWRFPSGAKVIFGYCERDVDVYQYQGQQFQWIGIDELGHYATPRVWEYLSSRLRSTDRGLPCYMRATCNPGPKWIMERFGIDTTGKPSSVVVELDDVKIVRRFIPSRLQDNPHLKGTGYEQRLKLLADADRRALLYGEWGVIDVPGSYYGVLIKRARDDERIAHVPYEPKLPVHTFWDLGVGDSTAIWFAQIHSSERRLIDYYEASGEGFNHYRQVLNDKGYLYGQHWAPHDIEVRNLGADASTRREIAASLGIKFEIAPRASFDDGINAARMIFPTCYFDAKKCEKGIETLIHYRKDYNQRLGEFKTGPVHDWASHGADAFRYFAVSIDRVSNGNESWTKPLKYDGRGIV